jgi:hypothetical protein
VFEGDVTDAREEADEWLPLWALPPQYADGWPWEGSAEGRIYFSSGPSEGDEDEDLGVGGKKRLSIGPETSRGNGR